MFILKSAITLALLYSCFFFFLSKETFHRFNRFMLLGIMVVSLILPLLHFTTTHPTVINEEIYLMQNLIEEESIPVVIGQTATTPRITWMQILTIFYFTGVAAMLMLTLLQILALIRFMHNGVHHTDNQGNTVILHNDESISPFSVFRFIVMNVKDYENCRQYVLTHEQEHIRQGHTYDLLLLEAMKTIQWFNPFIWFLSRDLKTVHEYEADQAVINQGIDAKSYQQLLVMKVVGNRLQPFTNNLNHSSLKKRIFMMYQKPSNRWLMLKAFCAIPVIALTLNAFATPTPTNPVEDIVNTLENKEIPIFNEPQTPKVENLTAEKPSEENRPFSIHPVRDQYGRIIRFSHEGKPADGDFDCTAEHVFINGRQATEAELKNYKTLLANSKFELLKTANGTAKYDYKDKHGIIAITTDSRGTIDDDPLIILDGKVVEIPADFSTKQKNLDDEALLAKLFGIKKEDIASITVLKDGAATAIYGEKAKNGVISIETKGFAALPKDTVVAKDPFFENTLMQRLPGVEKQPDGHLTIHGKEVKKILLEGEEVYNKDEDHEVFEICEEPAKYPGGKAALMQFISQNLRYPKEALEQGVTGLIVVQFIVHEDGTCNDFKIIKNTATNPDGATITAMSQNNNTAAPSREEQSEARKTLEAEALRVCRLMPKWQPAKQRGRTVKMRQTIPFTFRLQ